MGYIIEMFLILLTLYSTIITTALAMPRWLQEATCNSPYLYLITYQLPMIIASKHNKANPALNIPLNPKEGSQNENPTEPLKQLVSIQNEPNNYNGDTDSNIDNSDDNSSNITVHCRRALIGFGYFLSSASPTVLLLCIAITNHYGYRESASILIILVAGLFGIFSLIILFYTIFYIIKSIHTSCN